jgi:hypothetical protein
VVQAQIEFVKNQIAEWGQLPEIFKLYYEDFTNSGQPVREFQDENLRRQLLQFLEVPDRALIEPTNNYGYNIRKIPGNLPSQISNLEELSKVCQFQIDF